MLKSALWLVRSAVTLSLLAFVQAVRASKPVENNLRVSDLPRKATTANEWLAQVEAATVQVTGVKVNRTSTGLEITLETAEGKPLQVDATKFRTEGNSPIADISNAVLVLPNAGEFSADNPTEAIASVRVIQLDASNIRVSVTGKQTLPTQRVTLRTGELVYSLNPKTPEEDEQLEIVVRGEIQGYRIPDATTATRTDAPIRDIPASIQVVPRQILQDRQVTRLEEALQNVSGVTFRGNLQGRDEVFSIRGFGSPFSPTPVMRDGFRNYSFFQGVPEVAF